MGGGNGMLPSVHTAAKTGDRPAHAPPPFPHTHSLDLPNENDSLAVDARQEIDLRIGASFTRFQTLLLQVVEREGGEGGREDRGGGKQSL